MNRTFVFLGLLFVSSISMASAKSIVCTDNSSRLTLSTGGTMYPVEGIYRYNKHNGKYGSTQMLGCAYVRHTKMDSLDCTETTYSVYTYLYLIPKNIFTQPSNSKFSMIEVSRDEGDGHHLSRRELSNCVVK